MKVIFLSLLCLVSFRGFSQDSLFYLELFPGDPPCVDSLNIKSGYYYSCQHDMTYEINSEFFGDTLVIHEYETEEAGVEDKEVERMFFIPEGENLRLFAIQHNHKGKFRNDLDKYREGKVFLRKK